MMGGSVGNVDVFQQTAVFMKERKQREESAAAQAKQYYSAAQQQARRRAADALKQKKSGWMPNMEDLLANAFAGIGGVGPGAYVGEDKASKVREGAGRFLWAIAQVCEEAVALHLSPSIRGHEEGAGGHGPRSEDDMMNVGSCQNSQFRHAHHASSLPQWLHMVAVNYKRNQ